MFEQSVIAVYSRLSKAEKAADKLRQSGFPLRQVSIVAENLENNCDLHGLVSISGIVKKDIETGLWCSEACENKHILKYQDHLKNGKFIVTVHGDNEKEIEETRAILRDTGEKSLKIHGEFKS